MEKAMEKKAKKMDKKTLIANGIFGAGAVVALVMLVLGVLHIFGKAMKNKMFPDVMGVFFWNYLIWGIIALIVTWVLRKLYLRKKA